MNAHALGARGRVVGPTDVPIHDIGRYLGTLFGRFDAGLVEVRFRRAAGGMGQCFFGVAELAQASAVIAGLGDRTDVYVGVAPRSSSSGRRSAIDVAGALWVDCDTAEATARLHALRPPPSVVVRSGSEHGRHAYWLMPSARPIAEVEELNRRLALALAADGRSADGARILRPPGTRNFKRVPAGAVSLERCEVELRCRPDELEPLLPRVPRRTPARRQRAAGGADPLRSVPPTAYVRALLGAEVDRSRKIRCPFHDDRTPSLHVYPTPEEGWYCFGCGRGTSIYDMAASAWGLETRGADFLELRDRLLALFGFDRG